ncbi:hypothetical protein COX58_02600 [archaeon CG_4_10_14_0_2_um_filter_Archaea_38_6]|nr:MAG: hypothetical protein COS64_02130 [archaeon CG06_land_8_20_14_3_00_37_11]PIX42778.1 MAG: hypothetical protein COZ55_01770 [archaeon CG_4_8_14_3_um_filter_38_5]PJA22252.1 MAG: hypothetical protein COX58_02600 [archaeon CG_4_10_14_0_2_um_filter_Archaea_38_6]
MVKLLRAYIAGLIFPATILSLALIVLNFAGLLFIIGIVPVYAIPLIWGFWNVLYFAVGKKCQIKNQNKRLWATGATLGFLLALTLIFVLRIPAMIGITGYLQIIPLVTATIIYGIFWRYIVKPLNRVLGLKD